MGVIGVGTTGGHTWALWVSDPDVQAEHRTLKGEVTPTRAP